MIVPIRCFTCGKVMADKFDYFQKEYAILKKEVEEKQHQTSHQQPENCSSFDDVFAKPILDKLGLYRYCCRRHMISTVDMMNII
jgi:DNA-directed RNA polymerase subunit N (RpoN/RPB10)